MVFNEAVCIFEQNPRSTTLHYIPNAYSGGAIITAAGKNIAPGLCTSTDTCMQTYTATMCKNNASSKAVTLTDARDGQTYTVRYINGNCWMTRNLAIGCNGSGSSYGSTVTSKALSSELSNVANSSSDSWNTPTASLTLGNSYTEARIECSSDYGAWYNYAAASAGTIATSSNNNDSAYNICPKNWTLPSASQMQTIAGPNGSGGMSTYVTDFSAVLGGHYYNGSLQATSSWGRWWTATRYSSSNQVFMDYSNNLLHYYTFGEGGYRTNGMYVRCTISS